MDEFDLVVHRRRFAKIGPKGSSSRAGLKARDGGFTLSENLYHDALKYQTKYDIIPYDIAKPLAVALFGFGQLLVLTSTHLLYLGDYFGILMDHRVEGFPLNIMRDPMYNGSTMCFLGTALWSRSPAGLVLSGLVYIVYTVALTYEGPPTDMIHSKRAAKSQ
ncbi:Phosphatidyl-N-methylethanolamine N-methyltransferase [Tulasnella sp. 424]|nr:Phosphatidyl-N-methylethanolamine N-methyltransferase [Tulasnella sp. 424]